MLFLHLKRFLLFLAPVLFMYDGKAQELGGGGGGGLKKIDIENAPDTLSKFLHGLS